MIKYQQGNIKYLIIADSALDIIFLPTEEQYARISSSFLLENLERDPALKAEYIPGGPALNLAQYLRTRSRGVSVVSVVGDDAASKDHLHTLKNLGVDVRGVHERKGAVARCIYVYKNSDEQFPSHWIGNVSEKPYIPKGKYFSEFLDAHDVMIFSVTHPLIATSLLKDFKKTVAYNPGPVFNYLSFEETRFREIVSRTTILSLNNKEANYVSTAMNLKSVTDLFCADNPDLEVIIKTNAGEGAELYLKKEGVYTINPNEYSWNIHQSSILDDIGAGDAFFAVAIDEILNGKDPQEILQNATIVAQNSLRHRGGFNQKSEVVEKA